MTDSRPWILVLRPFLVRGGPSPVPRPPGSFLTPPGPFWRRQRPVSCRHVQSDAIRGPVNRRRLHSGAADAPSVAATFIPAPPTTRQPPPCFRATRSAGPVNRRHIHSAAAHEPSAAATSIPAPPATRQSPPTTRQLPPCSERRDPRAVRRRRVHPSGTLLSAAPTAVDPGTLVPERVRGTHGMSMIARTFESHVSSRL